MRQIVYTGLAIVGIEYRKVIAFLVKKMKKKKIDFQRSREPNDSAKSEKVPLSSPFL